MAHGSVAGTVASIVPRTVDPLKRTLNRLSDCLSFSFCERLVNDFAEGGMHGRYSYCGIAAAARHRLAPCAATRRSHTQHSFIYI